MFGAFWHGTAFVLLFGSAFLVGCSAQNTSNGATALNGAGNPPGAAFSLDTPVAAIVADPQGKVIIDRDIPGLLEDQKYMLFESMSLSQIAALSGGKITKPTLDQVQADLAQLSRSGKTGL